MAALAAGEGSSAERIVDVAAALFAARGFDGVSTRDIAAAAGLNIATVHHHVGRKADLYEAVFARQHGAERAVLEHVAAAFDDDTVGDAARLRAAVHAALDTYLAFLSEHPDAVRLWVRRWLDGPQGADELWQRYAAPLYRLIAERIGKAAANGVIDPLDPHLLARTIAWVTHGYLTGGLADPAAPAGAADPRDPEALARFRSFLRGLADRMLWGVGGLPR